MDIQVWDLRQSSTQKSPKRSVVSLKILQLSDEIHFIDVVLGVVERTEVMANVVQSPYEIPGSDFLTHRAGINFRRLQESDESTQAGKQIGPLRASGEHLVGGIDPIIGISDERELESPPPEIGWNAFTPGAAGEVTRTCGQAHYLWVRFENLDEAGACAFVYVHENRRTAVLLFPQ